MTEQKTLTLMETLQQKPKEDFINDAFNAFVREHADYEKDDTDPHGHGKRIPYIGWFWRDTDFVDKCISIGECGSFVGVMENNKWDYPERYMTEQETDTFIGFIERAYAELSKGKITERQDNADKVFREMWDWFQTLKIQDWHQTPKA